MDDLIGQVAAAPVEGITLLGGEPFDQAPALAILAGAARRAGLGVMTFTGYRHELLSRGLRPGWLDLLSATDLLVDGPYLESHPDLRRPWVGSTNQRFVHLSDRYRDLALTMEHDRVEIRIRRDGRVAVNGWPEDRLIETLEDLLAEPDDENQRMAP